MLSQGGKALEQPFTSQEIINEFITFVGSGSKTTGGDVGRALYRLSKNPQYKDELLEEFNKHFADPSKVMNEIRVILSLILKKYDFVLDPEDIHQMYKEYSMSPSM